MRAQASPVPNVVPVARSHRVTITIRDEVYQRLLEWGRDEKQPFEVIIAEILAANVGLG